MIVFRDKRGRFVAHVERYSPKVARVEAFRRGRWMTLAARRLSAKDLALVTTVTEFQRLPPVAKPLGKYTSKSKYAAWDIAGQIDKTPGAKGKLLKIEMRIKDGKRLKKIAFFHQTKKRRKNQAAIWGHMNTQLELVSKYLYKRVPGRLLANRRGKRVKLAEVAVSVMTP